MNFQLSVIATRFLGCPLFFFQFPKREFYFRFKVSPCQNRVPRRFPDRRLLRTYTIIRCRRSLSPVTYRNGVPTISGRPEVTENFTSRRIASLFSAPGVTSDYTDDIASKRLLRRDVKKKKRERERKKEGKVRRTDPVRNFFRPARTMHFRRAVGRAFV